MFQFYRFSVKHRVGEIIDPIANHSGQCMITRSVLHGLVLVSEDEEIYGRIQSSLLLGVLVKSGVGDVIVIAAFHLVLQLFQTVIVRPTQGQTDADVRMQHGVYCSTTGPTYETPAECRYFRIIGADTIGMSTTPEVIVARQGKIPVFGLSIVSDMGNIFGVDHTSEITHEEVIAAVNAVEPKLITLITELIRRSPEINL